MAERVRYAFFFFRIERAVVSTIPYSCRGGQPLCSGGGIVPEGNSRYGLFLTPESDLDSLPL